MIEGASSGGVTHEIERKFLVRETAFLQGARGRLIVQAYIAKNDRLSARVRISDGDAWLTLKGRSSGITRSEFEYQVPLSDARRMIAEFAASPTVRKTRYEIAYAEHTWEVDVFHGDNAGLVLAEIELTHESEHFEKPPWLGEEVTEDYRYANSNLSLKPFASWAMEYPAELPGLTRRVTSLEERRHAFSAHTG